MFLNPFHIEHHPFHIDGHQIRIGCFHMNAHYFDANPMRIKIALIEFTSTMD